MAGPTAAELKTLGRYNIERTLGKGAMGVVYEGLDPRLGRRVAIKTILKSHLDEDTAKDYSMRFVREAQAVARLNHPNIVQVYDFGEEGDIAYLVMEFIKGKELKTFFDANERFDLKEAVRIMCELCDALDFAHNAGIIHRDIKPANVMLDAQARTKLTDFGVARVQDSDKTSVERTQAGTMVGTPAYMSPEQITGGQIDKRTDVFSAGIILYQFLTGEKPFTGSGAWTIAKKIIQEEPPLPSSLNNAVTPLFDAVVNKALAKNPEQRFQSARDLAVHLKRALEGKADEDDSDRTVVGIMGADAAPSRPAPVVAKAPAQDSARTSPSGTGASQEVELEFWRAIKDGNDPDDFELYVQQFPTGIYAALAKRKIAKLRGLPLEESSAKAKEQERKEAEEAARREAEVKAKLEAEKARLEAEMARKEEEYRRREAEAEAKRQEAEKARLEAEEKARREAEAKAKAEAHARAEAERKAREEFARREAELKKRVAEAEAAPGGKREAIRYAAIVGVVVLAIAGVVIFMLPKEDPESARKLKAMQEQLEQAKKKADELEQAKEKEQEARVALEKARKAEEDARKSGDKTKEKELAEARKAAEAEAKQRADAAKTKEQEKLAAERAAEKAKADKDNLARQDDDRSTAGADKLADRLAAQKAAAERAAAEAKAAAEKLALEKAAAEKAAADARAATEKLAQAKAAQPSVAALQPTGASSFVLAQGLEGEGKGKEAVRTYISAARGGSCDAAKRLGDIYDKGLIGVSRDYAEALKWYNFARTLGTCEVPQPKGRL
jgi:eukaryotic-like serine/threonine-protein kinase